MQKWDYKVFYLPAHSGEWEAALKKLGEEGWELVAVKMPTGLAILKRPM